jgi:hypothetical protein
LTPEPRFGVYYIVRWFFLVPLLPGLASAAIWPDTFGNFHRTSAAAVALGDQPVWDEYGLKDSETAVYEAGSSRFTATAWVLQDTTGSLAAFDWQRPAAATPSSVAALAAETANGLLLVHGNYLLQFQGYKPTTPELDPLIENLANVDTTALPTLPRHLPTEGLRPGSERYILGPASLAKFYPGIPPSVAAFHLSAEAIAGVFQSPKGNVTMAIFDYPTPQIAMQRVVDFQNLPGAVAKRSGPLVAVSLSPADPDTAERLLSQVRYQVDITVNQRVPTRRDNIGDLIINAFTLIGILLAFSFVAGLALGGVRAALRRGRTGPEDGGMITLRLG